MRKKEYTPAAIVELLKSQIGYGKTQKDLAEEVGISRSYLAEVLAGKKHLSTEAIESMGFKVFYRRDGNGTLKICKPKKEK